MAEELKILKNSNALNKYAVDADELNYNFKVLADAQGESMIKNAIESSGQVYSPIITTQLGKAIAQYVLSYNLFEDVGTTQNAYILYPKESFTLPNKYTQYMEVSFVVSRQNTGACTLQIGELESFPIYLGGTSVSSGVLSEGRLLTVRLVGDYWSIVDGNTGTGSTVDSYTNSSVQEQIKYLITNAGITYDENNIKQLSYAVSQYINTNCYTSTYDSTTNGYKLTNTHQPVSYQENMLVSFVVDNTNTQISPTITVGNLITVRLFDFFGGKLEAGRLKKGDFINCICKKTNGEYAFYVVSDHLNSLSLGDGIVVDYISNDTSLSLSSSKSLVTENAVKQYVDAKVKSSNPNTIISCYTNSSQENASLRNLGDHALQLLAGSDSCIVIKQTDSGKILASNEANKTHPISMVYDFSWESGTDVLNAYYGFKDISDKVEFLKIRHTDTDHTPIGIKVLISYDGANWLTFVDDELGTTNYGDLSTMHADEEGYYKINLPNKVMSGAEIQDFSPTAPYSIKVCPTSMRTYKVEGSETEIMYTWKMVDIYFGKVLQNIPTFSVIYRDGTIENINNECFYTQYEKNTEEETPTLELTDITDGKYFIYKQQNGSKLQIIRWGDIIYQDTEPSATASNDGCFWVNISVSPYETFVCVEDAESSGTYKWEPITFILLGEVTFSDNKITNVINLRKGTTYVSEYAMTSDFTKDIAHNFGSDVKVDCYLVCSVENNSYTVGEEILLDYYMFQIATEDGSGLSYFLVTNTNMTTKISCKNLQIIDRSGPEFVVLPSDKWKLRVYINKD